MRQQQGSILVFVVLTVAVLMIYGVTFASATVAEYRAAMHHTQGIQAFNIAEAGLNWARRGLHSGSIVLPAIGVGQTRVIYRSAAFGTPVGAQVLADIGEVEVRVARIRSVGGAAPHLELIAEGRQGQARRTVSILVNETAGFPPEDVLTRHQVVGAVTMRDDAVIRGDISGASFTLSGDAVIHGTDIVAPPLTTFAPPAFSLPTGLAARSAVVVRGDSVTTLPGSGNYPSITVEGNGVLLISVPDERDVIIRTDTFTVRNDARINITGTGTGRVLLHVRESVLLRNNARINVNGHIARFMLYHHGTAPLSLSNDVSFTGIVVTNSAPVTVENDARLTGHLITGSGSVVIRNDAVVTGVVYAPQAAVEIRDDGRVTGTVIAGGLNLRHDAEITYATGGFASFTPMVPDLGLWPTAASYSFHTWGSR